MDYSYQSLLVWAAGVNYYVDHGCVRKQILFSIDLCLSPGEIVMITGPSGSGKSTLLSLIGALRSHQEGELYVLGQGMLSAKRRTADRLRQKLGFVFQEASLIESLTAIENICVGFSRALGNRENYYENAQQLLRRLGMEAKLNHYPSQLSGGQRQRVAIARSLLRRPRLILADEPTASLDAATSQLAMELLQAEIQRNQSGLILVTHDPRLLSHASRIVHIVDGYQQNNHDRYWTAKSNSLQASMNSQAAA